MTFPYHSGHFMQFLAKMCLGNILSSHSTLYEVDIAKHRFPIQCLTFDAIPSRNILINYPPFLTYPEWGLADIKFYMHIWTF